jgi:hypothetical protein
MTETLEDIAEQTQVLGNVGTRTQYGKKRGTLVSRRPQPPPLKRIIGGINSGRRHVKITLHTGPIK